MSSFTGVNGPKGQIWILAALSLPYKDRVAAMNDIAEMLGANFAAVQSAASRLKAQRHGEAGKAGMARGHDKPSALPPSLLRQPTRAQLMAGRAR